jgi:hypothetical protein
MGERFYVFAPHATPRYAARPPFRENTMRADVEAGAADIEQSIGLLRRRL